MAIQPIDLQTMYSQLANVSKEVGGQQNAAQFSQTVHMETVAQQNLENSTKVQASSNEQSLANSVDPDGKNNSGAQQQQQSKKRYGQDIQPDNNITATDDSRLGRIVDITR